jgi:tetratricopeptide (TPR) repeat protein
VVNGVLLDATDSASPDNWASGHASRISMLETVRAFAADRLRAACEDERAHAAHARYFLQLAEAAAVHLKGGNQPAALARLDQERANLYAALTWCVETNEATLGLRVASALGFYWELRGLIGEGRAWLERLLALADAHAALHNTLEGVEASEVTPGTAGEWRAVRARALNGAGTLAVWQCDYLSALARLEEALALRRTLGDERAIAGAVNNLGGLALMQGDYRRAEVLLQDTAVLRERVGEPRGVALAQLNLGIIACKQGRARRAHLFLLEAERSFATLGDQAMRAVAVIGLGEVRQQLGDAVGAEAAFQQALELARSAGRVSSIILALYRLAELARLRGVTEEGLDRCDEALALAEEHEELREAAHAVWVEGSLWLERGELHAAAESLRDSQARCEQLDERQGLAEVALWRGRLAAAASDWSGAQEQYWASLALRHALGTVRGVSDCLESLAEAFAEGPVVGMAYEPVTAGRVEEVDEIIAWLCAVAERALDGASALRSPREQRAYAHLQERMHRPVMEHGVILPQAVAGREDDLVPAFILRALTSERAGIMRGLLTDVSTLLRVV